MIRGGGDEDEAGPGTVQQRMWGGSETCDERGWEGSHRHCSLTVPLPNKTWFHVSLPGPCLFPLWWFSSPMTSFPPICRTHSSTHLWPARTRPRLHWTLEACRPIPRLALSRPVRPPVSLSPYAGLPSVIGGPRDECEHPPKKGTKLVSLPPSPHQNHILLPTHCLPGRQGFPLLSH